jgi:hypothetical protein
LSGSKDYKAQVSLAKEGHWRFAAARKSDLAAMKATSGEKRKATEDAGGGGEPPLSSGLPSARGERRGLSDIDEEDAVRTHSHRPLPPPPHSAQLTTATSIPVVANMTPLLCALCWLCASGNEAVAQPLHCTDHQ